MADKVDTCEHCGGGPFTNDAKLWNHPCPGRETTIQRSPQVLVGYQPDAEGKADLEKPVYDARPMPVKGEIVERPGGRHAKVVSATMVDGSQIIGLRYID